MTKLNILHVVRQFYPSVGGIENVVFNLSKELINRGNHVEVVALNRKWENPRLLESKDEVSGIKIRRIPYFGSRRYPIALSVINHIKEFDIVHIHSTDFFLDYLSLTKIIHRKPLILHSHGLFFHTDYARQLKKFYFHTITRMALHNIDAAICVSKQDFDLLKRVIRVEKLVQIPNGVDLESFQVDGQERDSFLILSVGRLSTNKRYDKLLNTFQKVLEVEPRARLVIIGKDQGELSNLRNLCDGLMISQRVQFLGEVTELDLKNYYGRANLWVSTSEYESFGLSLLESMAAGCVPVVSPLGAHQELITNQTNGFVIEFNDFSTAAENLVRFLNLSVDERKQIVYQAKITAKEYSWERIAGRVETVYKKVLKL